MEERRLREGLAGLHVPYGGRAAVAEQLEHLEAPLGEQVEGVGRVPLQEQGLFRADAALLGDAGEPLELVLVEVREEGAGAQVGHCAVVLHGRSIAGAHAGGTAPAVAFVEAGTTTIAERPSRGHLYSQMPQPMQRLATTSAARPRPCRRSRA